VRSAEQFDSATGRNADMDRAHHDFVGAGFGLHGVGVIARVVLPFAVSAGSG